MIAGAKRSCSQTPARSGEPSGTPVRSNESYSKKSSEANSQHSLRSRTTNHDNLTIVLRKWARHTTHSRLLSLTPLYGMNYNSQGRRAREPRFNLTFIRLFICSETSVCIRSPRFSYLIPKRLDCITIMCELRGELTGRRCRSLALLLVLQGLQEKHSEFLVECSITGSASF